MKDDEAFLLIFCHLVLPAQQQSEVASYYPFESPNMEGKYRLSSKNLAIILLLVASCESINAFLSLTRTGFRPPLHLDGTFSGDFDYSSTTGWETYYQQDPSAITEWHSSIPLETLADLVPQACNCLMIGTGTSNFPELLRARRQAKITLLDSSMTCIEQLKQRYGDSMNYVCGDATKLSCQLFAVEPDSKFDMIVDKGLMDALLCGEGWNTPISALLHEAVKVLKPNGSYLLVSYRLPTSTQDFLRQVGEQVGLKWRFNVSASNDRVGVSIAHKVLER